MRIGYERVSTEGQSTLRQDDMMMNLHIDKVYVEKISGKSRDRPKLKQMLASVQEGDVIIIESISRISRSTRDFLNILHELEEKGVSIISLKERMDSTTPTGRFMINIFASIAQLEREQILLRMKEGIASQKARGIYKGGRPLSEVNPELLESIRSRWRCGEISYLDAMEALQVSKATFYRLMNGNEPEEKSEEQNHER